MNRPIPSIATVIVVSLCLVATLVVTTVATWTNALVLVLVGVLAAAGLVVAISRPTILFYVYCAAIPFNFALPPGPAGTISRIAGLLFFLGYLLRRPDSLRPGTIPVVGWAFMVWTLMSCIWAIDSGFAFQAWISLAQLFAITVLISSIVSADPTIVRPGLWAYAIAASVTAAIGIAAYFQGGGVFGRATASTSQDPALFASIVVPAAIFLMGEVQSRGTRGLVRFAALTSLTICVAALALSGTRSAWVGIVIAVVVWLLIRRDRRQIIAVAAVSFGVGLLIVGMPGVGAFVFGRIEDSLATGGAGRTDIWIVGLSILASVPLVGVGLANFGLAFSPYAIAHASGASNASGALFADRGAHNVLLATTVETGIIGGLLLVGFLASALVKSLGERGDIVRVALVGLYVQAMFLDIQAQKQLWLFLGLAFGLIAAERITSVRGLGKPEALRRPDTPAPQLA